jgi:hypothetical protein
MCEKIKCVVRACATLQPHDSPRKLIEIINGHMRSKGCCYTLRTDGLIVFEKLIPDSY